MKLFAAHIHIVVKLKKKYICVMEGREKGRQLGSKLISFCFGVKNKYSSTLLGFDFIFILSL